jgi:enoyl-CoA hydratase
MPRGAVAAAKEAIDHGILAGLEDGLEAEREFFGQCFTRDEQKDAMKAFLEKRKKQGN